jgi:predicted nucleic acid-binding protein
MELEDSLLLLDDLKARKLAKKLKLKFTGALGVISKAKQKGLISEVKPLLDKLVLTNFRISDIILNEILRINDEM